MEIHFECIGYLDYVEIIRTWNSRNERRIAGPSLEKGEIYIGRGKYKQLGHAHYKYKDPNTTEEKYATLDSDKFLKFGQPEKILIIKTQLGIMSFPYKRENNTYPFAPRNLIQFRKEF